jgi:ethanolamine utilization protein EutN
MIIGKVVGQIYSTINHGFYNHKRILIINKITPSGMSEGNYLIAVDSVDAGIGETVLVIDEGNSARQVVKDNTAPIRSIIIGIVDEISYEG